MYTSFIPDDSHIVSEIVIFRRYLLFMDMIISIFRHDMMIKKSVPIVIKSNGWMSVSISSSLVPKERKKGT